MDEVLVLKSVIWAPQPDGDEEDEDHSFSCDCGACGDGEEDEDQPSSSPDPNQKKRPPEHFGALLFAIALVAIIVFCIAASLQRSG